MRLIDADALMAVMYHEAFETDSDRQKWDSGCWIRYKMFEEHIANAPTVGEWIPVSERLPSKSGTYLVTVDSMRHGMVDIFHYGKPLMPNIAVKGMCWYRDDDEWGDVVYDDKDIFAWMPLPEPYREDGEV